MKNRIFAISGSPRKNGNTNYLLNQLIERIGFDHETITLHGNSSQPCDDCRGCKKEPFNCIMQDVLQNNYKKIENSEYLVFATPIYWFTPSAQMKALIDRLRPYYGNKKLKGKKAIVILVAGVGETDCDLTEEMFKRIFNALEIELIGTIKSKAFDIGDAERDEIAKEQIDKIAKSIHL